MSKYSADVEADGPCPGKYSMISIGVVKIGSDGTTKDVFKGEIKPISDVWIPEALAVSGLTREQTMAFTIPKYVMQDLALWVKHTNEGGRPMLFSDNNGFDWQFINYYFHVYYGSNPFGHSSTNIGSLYKGYVNNMKKNHKHLRITKHSHDPVDDAMGNAEALIAMKNSGFNITF